MTTVTATPAVQDTAANWTRKPELLALLTERNAQMEIERKGKAAEKLRKELDAQILAAMAVDGATSIIVNGQTVAKHAHGTSTGVDQTELAQGFPEAYAATAYRRPYTYLKAL